MILANIPITAMARNKIIPTQYRYKKQRLGNIIATRIRARITDIIQRRILRKNLLKPYLHDKEMEVMEEILRNLRPLKCLEYGSGFSTVYFSKFLDKNSKWIAMEHDKEWFEKIKNINKSPNIEVFLVPPNRYPWQGKEEDGTYYDFKEYIEFTGRFGKFDFIFIDGRAREHCLVKAYELLEDDGIVVLHDAQRVYYHRPLKLYKYQMVIDAEGIAHLWVGSKGLDLKTILDIDKYEKAWQVYAKLNIWFRRRLL